MRRILGLALALLAIANTIGWTTPVLAEGAGAIEGQVVNKTPDGSPVGGVEVILITYLNDKPTASQQKVTAGASGKFEFKGLSTDNGTAYAVRATFQDASYTSGQVTLTPASASQAVELDVYDSTTSDANIQISNGHIVAFANQGALQVLEVWRFSNTGSKTLIGTKGKTAGATLQFTLPRGATSLSPGGSFALQTTDAGAIFAEPVPPGATDITFSYHIPYEGSAITMTRKADYPISAFRFLVEDTGVKVTSSALIPGAPQMMNGTNYLDFSATNVARGVNLDASFSGIVEVSAGSTDDSFPLPWLLGGAAMLALIVAVGYPQLRKQQARSGFPEALAPPEPFSPAPIQEEALLRELARLDDAYEAGLIKEREYRARRAQTKGILMRFHVTSSRTHDDRGELG